MAFQRIGAGASSIRKDRSLFTKKLTKEALQDCLITLPLLAPKMESEGAPSILFLKLTPIDALHKRCIRFPSLSPS